MPPNDQLHHDVIVLQQQMLQSSLDRQELWVAVQESTKEHNAMSARIDSLESTRDKSSGFVKGIYIGLYIVGALLVAAVGMLVNITSLLAHSRLMVK